MFIDRAYIQCVRGYCDTKRAKYCPTTSLQTQDVLSPNIVTPVQILNQSHILTQADTAQRQTHATVEMLLL